MKTRFYVMIALALLFQLFIIEACSEKETEKLNEKSRNDELIVKGSDSEFELMESLLKEFSTAENGIKYTISGGGSGKGIEALIKNEVNIATSSRELNQEELDWANDEGVEAVPLIFALDAVAFITHPMIGVDSLTPLQLKKIYSGEIKNWKELGGADLQIFLIGRNEHSGTQGYIFNKLQLKKWSPEIIEREHGTEVYDEVRMREGSIGYLSLGTIVSNIGKPVPDVWAMNIYTDYSKSISPYEIMKVQNGEYYFSRPLYLYFNGKPQGTILKFTEFVLQEKIQNDLWNYGYFPITEFQSKMNRKNDLYE